MLFHSAHLQEPVMYLPNNHSNFVFFLHSLLISSITPCTGPWASVPHSSRRSPEVLGISAEQKGQTFHPQSPAKYSLSRKKWWFGIPEWQGRRCVLSSICMGLESWSLDMDLNQALVWLYVCHRYTGFLPLEGVYEEDTCRTMLSESFLERVSKV